MSATAARTGCGIPPGARVCATAALQSRNARGGLRTHRWLLFGFNVYEEEAKNGNGAIFGYGRLQNYNLSVRGGTDAVRYFASASRDDDIGIVEWNWDKRIALRANMEMLLSNAVTVGVNTSYI